MASNSQVAHIYANQSKASAKSGNGNFSFEGRVAYSYSTPIANMVDGADGAKVCLITSRSYSVTTNGKHISPLHRATNYGHDFIRTFVVPFIGAFGGRNRETNVQNWHDDSVNVSALAAMHKGNLDHFAAEYSALVASLPRKTSWDVTADYARESLSRWADAAHKYAVAFGLDFDAACFDVVADAAAIIAKIEARRTPEAIAKRERAAAVRKAAADAKARREAAERIVREAEARAAFYAGSRVGGFGLHLRDDRGGALLRVSADGETLQTSLGADVPLSHAVKVFRFVKLCRDRGEAWHRNGRCIRVGHFQVDRIAADGDFWAGCHRINWPEVARLASALGLADAAGSDAALETSAAH